MTAKHYVLQNEMKQLLVNCKQHWI